VAGRARLVSPRTALWALGLPASFVLGAMVGSFLNVVAYRVPRRLSIAAPRSFCPRCRRQLAWWENIPVVSWLVLRGRCRTCRAPISVRYLAVEIATGLVFVGVTAGWRGGFPTPGYFALAATLVVVTVIERDGIRAPLSVAAVGTGIGAIALWIGATAAEAWGFLGLAGIGLAGGIAVFALLRRWDPEARWPAAFGRSMLLPAGPWLAATGGRPAGIGLAAGTVAYLVALTVCSLVARRRPATCSEARTSTGRDSGVGPGDPCDGSICETCTVGTASTGTCSADGRGGRRPALPPLTTGVLFAVAAALLVR
jgi:prepilin signal peptidase PulO-like enzyme (type II secretory pathway)